MNKILIDCRWLDLTPRGIGVFNLGLLDGIKKILVPSDEFKITLLVTKDFKEHALIRYGNFFEYIDTPRFPDPIYDLFVFQILQNIYKFDLIHLTGNTGPVFFFNKPKVVLTIHDVSYFKLNHYSRKKTIRQKIGRWYRKLLVPIVAKHSDSVVTVSKFAAADIVAELGLARYPYVIGHGINFDEHLNKHNAKSDYFIVISGRDPQKNIMIVVQAAAMLENSYQNPIKLKIIGLTCEEFHGMHPKVPIPRGVIFCGKLTHNETLISIKNAICTIIPSHYESFGLPVIESLFMGTPVICSIGGALGEIAGDAGIYFDPLNNESLVRAILEFQKDGESNKRIDDWVNFNLPKYSWKNVAKEYLDRYRLALCE